MPQPATNSRWRHESGLLVRYAGSGAVNTLVGFGIIGLLSALGISPLVANICGYAVGFTLGFLLTKRFVFQSEGRWVTESLRHLLAFIVCFLLNLLVLEIALRQLLWPVLFAQLAAAATYTGCMYASARLFVFTAPNR